jgi:hypothetical protein
MVTLPWGVVVVPAVEVRASPVGAVTSLATEPEMGWFSVPVLESLTAATGVGATVTVMVAVEVSPDLSVTVYWNESVPV